MAEIANTRQTIRVAITVIAYPVISSALGEVVCVAGIRTDSLMEPEWVRLYPFQRRNLPKDRQIHKWDELEISVAKSTHDYRPESWAPNLDAFKKIGSLTSEHGWRMRRPLVEPLIVDTMADVERAQEAEGSSLAAVRSGEVLDLLITKRSAKDLAEASRKADAAAAQGDLFSLDEKAQDPLEPIPIDVHYLVRYDDESEPRRLKVIDHELGQAYRRWRHQYEDVNAAIRTKWLDDLCAPRNNTVFFIGNQKRFPEQFMVLGVYYPPK
jgi:hypothetical protein